MQKMRVSFIIILLGTILCSCRDNSTIENSVLYQEEEITVYKQLMDELLDSAGYEVMDTARQLFYMFDSLDNVDNIGDNEFLAIKLETRKFSISDLTKTSQHKYIKATDTLRIANGEYFTRRWLTISRVCFDKEMTRGFLHFKIWCGDVCSQTDTYEVDKLDGEWRIKSRIRGPIS